MRIESSAFCMAMSVEWMSVDSPEAMRSIATSASACAEFTCSIESERISPKDFPDT